MMEMVLCPKAGSLAFTPPGDEMSEVVSRCLSQRGALQILKHDTISHSHSLSSAYENTHKWHLHLRTLSNCSINVSAHSLKL